MYRQLAYSATKKALLQYFDMMEPIIPPPRGEHWIENANEVQILMGTQGGGYVHLNPDTRSATVLIDVHEIYQYIPGDEEFHEEMFGHVPMQHNIVLPDEYVLTVDLSDEDWGAGDEIFDRKTQFKRRPPPTHSHKGIHRR